MTTHVCLAKAIALAAAFAAAPVFAHRPPPAPPTPICTDLANNPTWGLAGNPAITGLTAVITPATAHQRGVLPGELHRRVARRPLLRLHARPDVEVPASAWACR